MEQVSTIGRVERLWRYPVKSMRGEELETAYVGFSGVYGDRVFAFRSADRPKSFPYLTARSQKAMLQYRPRFRAAETRTPTDSSDLTVDVETPNGEIIAIDDPALIRHLGDGLRESTTITLLRSVEAMTDCRPVSLISIQTARQIGDELGIPVDPRRFRANIYLNLSDAGGFGEDAFVGRTLRLGPQVVLSILERDKRCRMITLDPDSSESSPAILEKVVHDHDGAAGIYAVVLAEGAVHRGDPIELLD